MFFKSQMHAPQPSLARDWERLTQQMQAPIVQDWDYSARPKIVTMPPATSLPVTTSRDEMIGAGPTPPHDSADKSFVLLAPPQPMYEDISDHEDIEPDYILPHNHNLIDMMEAYMGNPSTPDVLDQAIAMQAEENAFPVLHMPYLTQSGSNIDTMVDVALTQHFMQEDSSPAEGNSDTKSAEESSPSSTASSTSSPDTTMDGMLPPPSKNDVDAKLLLLQPYPIFTREQLDQISKGHYLEQVPNTLQEPQPSASCRANKLQADALDSYQRELLTLRASTDDEIFCRIMSTRNVIRTHLKDHQTLPKKQVKRLFRQELQLRFPTGEDLFAMRSPTHPNFRQHLSVTTTDL
jgi:hypothetical protein